jgi:hypothetical protein
MNKFIIFCCFFVAISSLCTEILSNETMSYYCQNKTLDESERNIADTCCYVSYRINSGNLNHLCSPYRKSDVPIYIKNVSRDFKDLKIDCASTWISYRLFLIVLIFII